jgi:PAS domain S-box-containing protein
VKLSPFFHRDVERAANPEGKEPGPPKSSRIFGEGEMADRIRSCRWEATPLGPLTQWPQTLVWAVNTMLESRLPTSILWGADMLQFYNDAYLPLTAEKHPQLLGQPCAKAWPEAWQIIGPQCEAVLQSGAAFYREGVLVPVLREGAMRDVYWAYSYSPLRDEEGEVSGILVICNDISAGKQGREALEKSERRLRLAQDAGRLVIWEWDLKANTFLCTGDTAGVFGRDAAELDSLAAVISTIHPDDREASLAAAREATKNRTGYSLEFRITWPDQSIHWIAARGKGIYDSDGEAQYMVGTTWDITERKRGEAILLNEQTRLTSFANSIPTLAWMADETGSIFWYNQRWYEYTGMTPEQMEGWGWQSVHDPEILPQVMERWKSSLETKTPFEMIFPLRGKDGVFRSFMTRIDPVKNAEGAVTQWFGLNTEVDELERTRTELAVERSRLNAVLENVPVGLVFSDAHGKLLGGNPAAERIFRHPVFLSPGVQQYGEWISYHPDGRRLQADEYPLAQTLADGTNHSGEYLYQRGDGTRAWVVFASAPIRDAHGNLSGAVVATLDIDEQKRAQDELREKNKLVEIAQTAARAGFWQYYPDTGRCYLSFGSQRLFELDGLDNVELSHVIERIHPEDRARVQADLEHALGTEFFQSTFRVVGNDGEIFWISGQARLMQNVQGESYFAGFSLDITSQKRAEEALRKTEKLAVAGRLAATIAHEINNPLEAVTNLLYILRTSNIDEQSRQYALNAEEELSRVTQIVTQSLRFHRSSTAATVEKISAILDSAAAIYKSRLMLDQVQLLRRYRDEDPVCCYNSEIRQVFGNLIGNAFDAIRNGGIIFLRTRDAKDPVSERVGVRVTVADTGHGMDAQTLKRTSEPFFTTKGINGTGLGLWISRDILNKHHAVMRVRSRRQGASTGTVFSIFIPAAAENSEDQVAVG